MIVTLQVCKIFHLFIYYLNNSQTIEWVFFPKEVIVNKI